MQKVNLVLGVLAVCIAACYGASLDSPVETKQNPRFLGLLNRYYVSTWHLLLEEGRDYQTVFNNPESIEDIRFEGIETVVIVVHGREDSAFGEFATTIRTSFLTHDRSTAVILVDWSFVSHLSYSQASAAVPHVASDLFDFLELLEVADRVHRDRLHLVGFDLGAHIVGIVSRQGSNTSSRARKITALDPAGENWGTFSPRLRATDAQTVEVIHSDGIGRRAYGIGEPIGTYDFFPNGGTKQPGCNNNLCNHNRAWQLFAATVDMNGHLVGHNCNNMAQVNDDSCAGPVAVMGSSALIKLAAGLYRVNTGRQWPFYV